MKAFTQDFDRESMINFLRSGAIPKVTVKPGIPLNSHPEVAYFCLSTNLQNLEKHKFKVDRKNPPTIDWGRPRDSHGYVYECGISERSTEYGLERVLTASRPGDNRALLWIGGSPFDLKQLAHVQNESFPMIVDSIGANDVTLVPQYLLLFKPGDIIKFRFNSVKLPDDYALCWNGNQFFATNPSPSLRMKPNPWKEL